MARPEFDPRRERVERTNQAFAGLFKQYSERVCERGGMSSVWSTELELQSGERRQFVLFGAFTDLREEKKPEVLVLSSDDANIRAVARATWDGNNPVVQDVDSWTGMRTITGTVQNLGQESMSLGDEVTVSRELENDEFLDILNKMSLSLRFSDGIEGQ